MDKDPDGTPHGIDVDVARGLGRILGRPIEFHWCASADCGWHCLPEKRCDVVIGQPVGSGPPRAVAWSVPYAGAQFGLVVPLGTRDVHTLADLRGRRVGIVAGTVVLSERDHVIERFPAREALLHALEAGRVNAAFMDTDFAQWFLHQRLQARLRLLNEYVPREHWNVGMAVRVADSRLLLDINRALAQLSESGELRKIYAAHGVPFRAPFETSKNVKPVSTTWRQIRERGEMAVSFDPANLPYSSAQTDRPGFDVELATVLARRLGVKLRINWLDVQRESAIGRLLQAECDLVFGEAAAPNTVADDQELAKKVIYSRPYYGTGYVLVQRKTGPHARSLVELRGPRSERLGTEAGSLADYSLRQRGYLRRLFRNQLATLTALNDGGIDFAYLWANVGWTLHVSPGLALEIVPGYEPEDRWNIAVAMRREDDELKAHVDAALKELIADGTVARALSHYHVPLYPTTTGSSSDLSTGTGLPIHHTAANRGFEPRMERIQGSKQPYSALARVRTAGELVVGLDQNNLPFSAAQPQPTGLDYEIACELAERLGVRPRVFWGIAAHDSYPSKLTAKALCDVILGVMPDDRFRQRVLYSRPYYHAEYVWVVRDGDASPLLQASVALEQGVAVQGLFGRSVRAFSSTETILEAVAAGRVDAGYVISTRGPWIAHQRFTGKLSFLREKEPLNRFPICAAVRKSDRDLKEAIDQVWNVLDQSGRMAEIFARWHVPRYELTGGQDNPAGAPGRPLALAQTTVAPEQASLVEGQALFRGLCTGCHGGTGRGGKGPDLTDNRWIHGGTDQDIARVIQNGVPRTTMKRLGDALKEDQIRSLIAYIRGLARSPGEVTWKPYLNGDSHAGRRLFFDPNGKANCGRCHSVGGEGGRIGPSLDRIASRRAPEFVMESILHPSQEIAPEYEAVIVATNTGRVITGLRVNETNFSIQVQADDGRYYSLLKRDVDEVKVLLKSLMPENFADVLTVRELHDLFTYLMNLE